MADRRAYRLTQVQPFCHSRVSTPLCAVWSPPQIYIVREKLIIAQLVKIYHAFYGKFSKTPKATGLHPEAYKSYPHPNTPVLKTHCNTFLPSTPRSTQWSLPFRLSNKFPYSYIIIIMRSTRPTHLILICLIIIIILIEKRKLRRSSFYLPPRVTSSLLGSSPLRN